MSDDQEFEVSKESLNREYSKWHEKFQAAKQEFDDKLDEIHQEIEQYLDCVSEAIVAKAYDEFPEHAHEIHTCEPYPEEETGISCAVFTESGKMIGVVQIPVEEIHDLAIRYLEEELEDDEIEDTEEYYFQENV